MVIAALGTVLAAAYLLWLFQRVAFGEPKPEFAGHGHRHDDHAFHDVNKFEWIAWTPLLIAILVFGVVESHVQSAGSSCSSSAFRIQGLITCFIPYSQLQPSG